MFKQFLYENLREKLRVKTGENRRNEPVKKNTWTYASNWSVCEAR
jgi:hypothetical protein